jgi:prepilin-type N-terminal cleavage/methylation domain-containing protein
MKKGFTLMEVLAVLMLVALVTSFAVPVYRSARNEMRYNQARAAATKLAEAMRTYYQRSKGYRIAQTSFNGLTDQGIIYATACDDVSASGLPATSSSKPDKDVSNLFGCGFLSYKDFAGLPFQFYICNPKGSSSNCGDKTELYVRMKGLEESGKYNDKYFNITHNMKWQEE